MGRLGKNTTRKKIILNSTKNCARLADLVLHAFRFYVTIRIKSVNEINSAGRSRIVDKYDVYVFNPWTGDFIGRNIPISKE